MRKAIGILIFLGVVSCRGSGVVSTGPNAYLVSKASAGGMYADMAALKGEVIREANDFARERGKTARKLSLEERRPVVGFPSVDYEFELVEP